MPFNEPAKKIKLKYRNLSPSTYLFLKRHIWKISLVFIPLLYISPHLLFFIFLFFFLWGIVSINYSPLPMFEGWKKRRAKNKEVLPYLFIGYDDLGLPIEIPASAMKQHMLLMGSTGSGKTSFLRRMIQTQLLYGGGCCFVDGKSDVGDMYQIFFSEVCHEDREEDFFLLNFLNPEQSHTFNPFLYGNADFIVEIMNGLIKEASGDNVYWQERATVMMRALMTVLVWKRDNDPNFYLSVSSINDNMNLNKMIEMAKDPLIPEFNEGGSPIKKRLIIYLESLTPNWAGKLQGEELSEAVRQFGYAVQQWSSALDLLSAVYGNIFNTNSPDIDIKDVVLNNKILYVLLPSLKQSPQTLKALGRLCLSVFKIVFAELIGETVVGDAQQIYELTKSKKPDPPFLMILDEYGSYATEGLDTVLAQARSTGVSVIISVQETASLFKTNEVEAKRLLNNTKIKICMAIDDQDTSKYYVDRVGQDWAFIPSVREDRGDIINTFGNIDGGYSYQKSERLQDLELYGLSPGHGYILYMNDIKKFYSPELKSTRPKTMRLCKFKEDIKYIIKHNIENFFVPVKINNHIIHKWTTKEMLDLWVFHKKFNVFDKIDNNIKQYMQDNNISNIDNLPEISMINEKDQNETEIDFELWYMNIQEQLSQDHLFYEKFLNYDSNVWQDFKNIINLIINKK